MDSCRTLRYGGDLNNMQCIISKLLLNYMESCTRFRWSHSKLSEVTLVYESLHGKIKLDVFTIEESKAPDPDEFSISCHNCWDTIKDDLMAMFEKIYENGKILSTKANFMSLIQDVALVWQKSHKPDSPNN